MIREFGEGVRLLLRGFGVWRTRPRLMSLGLLPAAIAFIVLVAALVPLFLSASAIADGLTPFADDWDPLWRGVLRGAVVFLIDVAAIIIAAATFTALALTIGDPFYQRIWRAVETDLGGAPPADGGSFWNSVGEGLRLVVLGVLIAVVVMVIGFIPVVGGALGTISGVVLVGRLLARELTGRALDARDLSPTDRAALFAGSRARVLGFGVATQLCFLVPGGAIAVMPAAVAGATMLARTMIDRSGRHPAAIAQTPRGEHARG